MSHRHVLLACAVTVLFGGCFADERWEGSLSRCTDNAGYNDDQVLLILDSPRPPVPSGLFGHGGERSEKTWNMTDISDAESGPAAFKFTARYEYSSNTVEEWEVDLQSKGGGGMEGDADITITTTLPIVGTTTVRVRCDIEFERVH